MEEKNPSEILATSGMHQKLALTLELMPEERTRDLALVTTLGRETVTSLQQEGYIAKSSAYTGQKGAENFLVDLLITIQQAVTYVGSNHAVIAEDIADISGLITIFGGIVPVLKRLREAHEKQVGKSESTDRQVRITTEIDGAPLVIETSDLDKAEAALKLALKYGSAHPAKATQVNTRSKVKIQGQVPARKKRRRR